MTIPPSLFAEWSNDPAINNAVCTATLDQSDVQITPDGQKGAIMVWKDERSGNNIYAQRFDAGGIPQWAANGIAICTAGGGQSEPQLTSDGTGGAIITWVDNRNSTLSVEQNDIYAQRVDTSGTVQWAPDGVPVFTMPGVAGGLQIVSDEDGGAIITWEDTPSLVVDVNIHAQRLNGSGVSQWPVNGVLISATSDPNSGAPKITQDGAGGAIITWPDVRTNLTTTTSDVHVDIYAQHIDTSGVLQWIPDGVPVCTATNGQIQPQITGDGAGGGIITWFDERASTGALYAQRVNTSGTIQWISDGVIISNAPGIGALPNNGGDSDIPARITGDGSGGAIITWYDNRNAATTMNDIYAQRVNTSGQIQWTTNGLAVCTAVNDQFSLNLINDGNGGAIITWTDTRDSDNTDRDIYAQRVNVDGIGLWGAEGLAVSLHAGDQQSQRLTGDGAGGAIFAWEDFRNDDQNGGDIYASRVTARGTLGEEASVVPLVDSTFTTGTSGWLQFGSTNAKQSAMHDPGNEALIAHVNSVAQDGDYRIIGWLSAASDTIRYAAVGSDHFIRAKFYIYAAGQTSSALNEIPNFRVRIASRFAYSSILQPFNHDNSDPEGTGLAQDVRPSTAPLFPSTYRVDLDPPDIPQLVGHSTTEGFLRLFEAYEGGHQGNGDLGLTESTIGVYPALADFTTTVPVTQNGLIKSYRTTDASGGDFGSNATVNTPGITGTGNSAVTILKNFNGSAETTGPMPSVNISTLGVTMETLSVLSDRYGACALDVFNDAGDQGNRLTRARVEPGKQYRVRFHATSTKQTNTQALMRFRVRTLKFLYTANLEVGSSQAQPAGNANNTIAAQVLPGIGNALPAFDQVIPGEQGGWYNVMMVSPMNADIQSSQPHIHAQDGPGVNTGGGNSKSRRDIQFGIDVIDTFSTQPNGVLEEGQMTVDRVDIEKYNLLLE